MAADGWRTLGDLIARARRSSATPQRVDFAEAVGISVSTLYNLEAARRRTYSPETIAAVEIALGWQPGSFERVARGGRPTSQRDPELERLIRAWRRLPPEAQRMLVAIAELALGAERG